MRRTDFLVIVLLVLGMCVNLNAQDQPSATSLYNDGLELIKAKNYAEGLPLMVQAVETADSTSENGMKVIKLAKRNGAIAAYYVGNDYRKEKNYEKAIETYSMGVEYSASFYANYIGLAQALEGKGETAAAIKAYIDAGDVSLKAKKEDKAEKMYSKAENIVAVTWGKKVWDDVEGYAMAYLEKRDNNSEVHYYLAYAKQKKGDAEAALASVGKAIELAGDTVNDKYYMTKAESLESLGKTAEAIETYGNVKDAKYSERAAYKIKELGGE